MTQAMSGNVKRKTKTVNRAAMPIFDQVCLNKPECTVLRPIASYSCNSFACTQVLELSVAYSQLSSVVLVVSMWDHKKVAKDIFLGEIQTQQQIILK